MHLCIRKHRDLAEEMIEKVQMLSRKRLVEAGLRAADHPTWTDGGWKVFLNHPEEVWRTVRYIEDNPIKMLAPPVVCVRHAVRQLASARGALAELAVCKGATQNRSLSLTACG